MKFHVEILIINTLLSMIIFTCNNNSSLLPSSFFISENFISDPIQEKGQYKKNSNVLQKLEQGDSKATISCLPQLSKEDYLNVINSHSISHVLVSHSIVSILHNEKSENRKEQRIPIASSSLGSSQIASSSSSNSSSLNINSVLPEEFLKTSSKRYCTLKSLTLPSALHQITKHTFIYATIGIDDEGKAWVSGITDHQKSILIDPSNGAILYSHEAKIFLKQRQALYIFRLIDIKKVKENQTIQDKQKQFQIRDDLLVRYTHTRVAGIINQNSEQLDKLMYENHTLPCDLDKSQLNQLQLFDDGVFFYPSKAKNVLVFREEASYQFIEHNTCIACNASKRIFILHNKSTKKLFVDNHDIGIATPDIILDTKDICCKLSVDGNVLLSITDRGRVVHVLNLDSKQTYGPFIPTQYNARFLDASFWYEETVVLLEQLVDTGTIRFLVLNYKDSNEFKLIGSLKDQPIFFKASFLHNLQKSKQVIFFGITADTKNLHTGVLTVEADRHPLPDVLFSNIIGPYCGEQITNMEIIWNTKIPINNYSTFGYDAKGNIYVSTRTQIFPIKRTSGFKINSLLKLTQNKIFFKENWAVILGNDNRFILCQASIVIDIYNELISADRSGTYTGDLLIILKSKTKNLIRKIDSEYRIYRVSNIYPNGSFMALDDKYPPNSIFVEYNPISLRIIPINNERLCIRIPFSEKIFHFEKRIIEVDNGTDKKQTKTSIRVTLNGKLLKDLSHHMPIDYHLVEVNESGTTVVAIIRDGSKDKIFVYDLENNLFWYDHGIPRDHINSIHFLDDQNLLFVSKIRRDISDRFDITSGTFTSSIHYKSFLGILSVASPDAQTHDYKFIDIPDNVSSIFNCLLVKKKHKEKFFQSATINDSSIVTEQYYFGFQYYSSSFAALRTSLVKLKVIKQERKLVIPF